MAMAWWQGGGKMLDRTYFKLFIWWNINGRNKTVFLVEIGVIKEQGAPEFESGQTCLCWWERARARCSAHQDCVTNNTNYQSNWAMLGCNPQINKTKYFRLCLSLYHEVSKRSCSHLRQTGKDDDSDKFVLNGQTDIDGHCDSLCSCRSQNSTLIRVLQSAIL